MILLYRLPCALAQTFGSLCGAHFAFSVYIEKQTVTTVLNNIYYADMLTERVDARKMVFVASSSHIDTPL